MSRTKHTTLIGKKNREYYCLDTTFKHDDGMTGATGTILRAVTKEEHKDRMERWDNPTKHHPLYHIWQEQVQEKETTKGFEEWIEEIPQNEKEDMEYDPSGAASLHEKVAEKHEKETGKEVYTVECIGGGRCVDKKSSWYDKVYNSETIKTIEEYEDEMNG